MQSTIYTDCKKLKMIKNKYQYMYTDVEVLFREEYKMYM